MSTPPSSSLAPAAHRFRFGAFDLDLREGELRKHGIRIKLQQKPLQILGMLLRTPGTFVTRAQLAECLWPGLHVRFEGSLNTAVNSLRQALGDSPRNPRYIETRAGRGYRFIAEVAAVGENASAPAERSAGDSIAVLPFENAGDRAMETICEGIAESVIANLSALDGLRVIARSLVSRFQGQDIEPRFVGQSLNVRAVITGRIVHREAKCVVSVEFVDVASGYRLWGKEYHCDADDVLPIGREIAKEVAKSLKLPVAGRRENHFESKYAADFGAYQDYLKGRSFCNRMTEEDVRKSVAYFEAALRQSPRYAPAYAGLADTYNLFANFGIVPSKEAHALAKEFTAKAMEIDPDLAEVYTSLAGVKLLYDWDWDAARTQFLAALDLNPNYAAAHQRYADLLAATGKAGEAAEQMRHAQQLEPLAPVLDMQIAWTSYVARDFKRAEEESWKALAMEPRFAAAQLTLGLAYEQMSLHEEALVELENARVCSDNHPSAVAALGHAFASAGKTDEAARMLRQLEEISQRRYVSGYWRAILHCGLRNEERALDSLECAFQERDVRMIWLKVEPRLDPLRGMSRFVRLLDQIGFNRA